MTVEPIEVRASLLLNGSPARKGVPLTYDISRAHAIEAICRAIEAHEADKKAFSDAVQEALDVPVVAQNVAHILLPFILPEPEPDPLVEVSDAIGVHRITLEQALAARGYKIVQKEADNG